MYVSAAMLERARQGDETAQSAIIAHLLPGIRRLAAANLTPGLEQEDAEQEGLIALFHAIDSYTVGGAAGFDTYAMRCIHNAIVDARLRTARKKHQPLNQSWPLEDTQGAPGPEEQAVYREEYRATIRIIRTGLTQTERRVLCAYLDGSSYREIARQLHMDVKAVGNALSRARKKLKTGRE